MESNFLAYLSLPDYKELRNSFTRESDLTGLADPVFLLMGSSTLRPIQADKFPCMSVDHMPEL